MTEKMLVVDDDPELSKIPVVMLTSFSTRGRGRASPLVADLNWKLKITSKSLLTHKSY